MLLLAFMGNKHIDIAKLIGEETHQEILKALPKQGETIAISSRFVLIKIFMFLTTKNSELIQDRHVFNGINFFDIKSGRFKQSCKFFAR